MRRRELITLIGGTVAAWPLATRAQQPAGVRHIAILMGYAEGDQEGQTFVAAFQEELQKLGWIKGRTVKIDTRWASPREPESRERVANELVAMHADLILSHGTPVTATLLQQTRTIPIIFVNVADPIGSGFVASFSRPVGNVTGLTNIEPTMASKWLEMIKEIAPGVSRLAFLFNPSAAAYAGYYLAPFKAGAASLGLQELDPPG